MTQTSKEHVAAWRQEWENQVNRSLERAGIEARVDCRSHAAKGENVEPMLHMGAAATELERNGETTRIGEENRARQERNEERKKQEAERGRRTGRRRRKPRSNAPSK
ncbi:hypothetical protein CCP3SC15_3520002 [Gammaproteobacteria bacterium]